MKKKCVFCGKDFVANHEGQKYCSYLCYRLEVATEMKNRYEPEKETMHAPIIRMTQRSHLGYARKKEKKLTDTEKNILKK